MKRVQAILLLTLFLAGILLVPPSGFTSSARLQETTFNVNENLTNNMKTTELPNDPAIRVALYNETNSTSPDYALGDMNTNYSLIAPLLTTAGYDVDILTFENILNHELSTANYDVLMLADNCPRENITNLVKEFWLGGGGVLSVDSSINYLAYYGILYRENESVSNGNGVFWSYEPEENATIQTLHPVTQSYEVGDVIKSSTGSSWAMVNLAKFNTTSVWGQTTVLAVDDDSPLWARAIAVDAYDRGGKVVHIGTGVGSYWTYDYEDMIVDAVNWLTPRPKGRVLFDVSHSNYYPVDVWDPTGFSASPRYSPLRDELVTRRYTFDKLWPSAAGNFTASKLAPYDIVIINTPEYNFTTNEVTAISEWVNMGGGLIALGEYTFYLEENQNINYLLSDTGLSVNLAANYLVSQFTTIELANHPTIEDVNELQFSGGSYVNYSGDASPLVMDGSNTVVATQEIGQGQIILAGDVNFLANYIGHSQNTEWAVNIANWLTAHDAGVLLYTDDPYGGGAYRSMVCQALNQLDTPFYLVFSETGLNASLNGTWFGDNWDLVIIDNCNTNIHTTYPHILDYLKSGRDLILTSWTLFLAEDPSLLSYMGVNATGNLVSNAPSYIWESSHPIFDGLITYSAPTLNVSDTIFFSIDGVTFSIYENATALTGATATEQEGNASIVMTNNGQTILNGFMLNNLYGDADASAYTDGFEIYMNEIALMLSLPDFDHPADISFEDGTTGHDITWNPTDSSPDTYEILVDGSVEDSGSWDGSAITYTVDDIGLGVHTVECRVVGDAGYPRGDIVVVTVVDTTDPSLNSPADITITVSSTGNTLTWIAQEANPDYFVITMNSTAWDSGDWDGSAIEVDLDELDVGVYFFKVRVNDTLGHFAEDTVVVTVTEGGLFGGLDTTTLLLIAAGVVILILVGVICSKRKK
jgi:hypothetical protein